MKKKRIFILILLAIIVALAIFLRSHMFIHGDFYLLPDQGRDLQLVKQIVVDHKIPLIGAHAGIGGLFHGPLWLFLLVPFFMLSHGDPFFTLIPVYLLVAVVIVVGGFFVGRRLYNAYIGLLFSFFLAISQIFVSTVSFTSNSQVMPLLFLFYLFFLIAFFRGKKNYLILVFLFIGLGFHFESAFAVFLIPLTIIAILLAKEKPSLKVLVISIIIFFLTVSNFIFFDLRHQFLMTNTVVHLLTGKIQASGSDMLYRNISVRFADRLHWFIVTVKSPLYSDTVTATSMLVFIFVIGLWLSLLKLIKKEKSTQTEYEILFASLAFVFLFSLYMFYPFGLEEHYIQSLNILAIFIFVLCLQPIVKYKLGLIFFAAFMLLNIIPAVTFLQQNYLTGQVYSNMTDGSYKNQLNAVDTVFRDAKGKQFGYFVYDAPIVTYGMDYLMWWQGTKYGYIPVSQKLSLTYLLMLPAPAGDLHAHDFWIKNTVRTKGKMIEKKKLAGDIIIEKLTVPQNDPPADPNYYQNLLFR